MSSQTAKDAFYNLRFSIADADGMLERSDGLYVHGKIFASLIDDDLLLELPPERIKDLEKRGLARPYVVKRDPTRSWVRVSDVQIWDELAREAHEYVGEPLVGGQS
jgi:hypothetical protein